jgi:5-methylcytosine-specific restriction protein A
MRVSFLNQHPLCVVCERFGRLIDARVVDHVVPIKQGGERFAATNLQSLCIRCHNRKTVTERAARQSSLTCDG